MKAAWILLLALLLPAAAPAQDELPAGTVLPVTLDHGLKARSVRPGRPIRAEVMQNIPGTPIRRHSHLVGQVVRASAEPNGVERLQLHFDAVEVKGRRIPLQAHLRAIASFMDVGDAQVPEEGASRGITPEVATTRQIGGEQVYRGGGSVNSGNLVVGKPAPYGVLVTPRAQGKCRGVVGQNTRPQAFWLFSSDACGVYGMANLHIEHAGRTAPIGDIVLATDEGQLNLPGGTAFLLRVSGESDSPSRR